MVKDRMRELVCIQEEMKEHDVAHLYPCPTDQKCVAVGNLLQQVGNIQDDIKKLKELVRHSHDLQCAFEVSPMEQNVLKEKMNSVAEKITQLSLQIRTQIQTVQPEESPKTIHDRVKGLHYRALLQQFYTTLNAYNSRLEKHKKQRKRSVERHESLLSECSLAENCVNELLNKDDFMFGIQCEVDKYSKQLDEIKSRNSHIKDLEAGIVSIHIMFIYVRDMINQHSVLLDNIEYEIKNSQYRVENATRQYKSAMKYKKKNPVKKLVTLPFLTVKKILAKI